MLKFQTQIYRINDILGWSERKELLISPDFQRRPVWSPSGKSYLIDSIIRGMPLPQIFIREKVIVRERKTVREVVDGQQRIRTILDFLDDKFTMMSVHNSTYAKLKFSQLPDEVQQEFLSFPISTNVLVGSDDSDVLKIFSRINAYSVPLNEQEKLNAQFVGAFKKDIDYLARLHLEFWRSNNIVSNNQIARMKEVELTAELITCMLSGLQNGKSKLKDIYKRYDESFPQMEYLEERFAEILQLTETLLNGNLKNMEFRRPPLFYSLFAALYDCKYGFGSTDEVLGKEFDPEQQEEVKMELFKINQTITEEMVFEEYEQFATASRSSTDKLQNRGIRHNVLTNVLRESFIND